MRRYFCDYGFHSAHLQDKSHASWNYFLNTGKTACGIIGGKLFFLQAGPRSKGEPAWHKQSA
jgi:hypothetical protein